MYSLFTSRSFAPHSSIMCLNNTSWCSTCPNHLCFRCHTVLAYVCLLSLSSVQLRLILIYPANSFHLSPNPHFLRFQSLSVCLCHRPTSLPGSLGPNNAENNVADICAFWVSTCGLDIKINHSVTVAAVVWHFMQLVLLLILFLLSPTSSYQQQTCLVYNRITFNSSVNVCGNILWSITASHSDYRDSIL